VNYAVFIRRPWKRKQYILLKHIYLYISWKLHSVNTQKKLMYTNLSVTILNCVRCILFRNIISHQPPIFLQEIQSQTKSNTETAGMIPLCTKALHRWFSSPTLNLFMLVKNVCMPEAIKNILSSGNACCQSVRNLSPPICYLNIWRLKYREILYRCYFVLAWILISSINGKM